MAATVTYAKGVAHIKEIKGDPEEEAREAYVELLCLNIEGNKYAYMWNVTDGQYQNRPPYAGSLYLNVDFDSDEGLEALFKKICTSGLESVEWIEPLHTI